jgi:NAD(P)-dependent dehydrogenase (short-subunit alcohol dehydrogenase family)
MPASADVPQGPPDMAARFRLDGRVVVVAGGGGGGIGTAVCRAAAELGATVAVLDVDEQLLELARVAVQEAGGRFAGHLVDVRSKPDVDRAFAAVVETFGRVDGLVNVVGGEKRHHWQPLLDFDLAHFDEVVELNARYTVLTAQAAARHLVAAGRPGSIVHISSVAAFSATPYQMAYGAAKAALLSLTRTMAVEWGRHGIRVNAVAPGTISTPRDHAGAVADGADGTGVLPLRRRGTGEELAAAVMFMLSDLSAFVTGQTLLVDGGALLRRADLDADDMSVFVRDPEIRERALGPAAIR